jgi:hypothetical protein
MNWTQAETALRTHIEVNWALSSYANIPLVWENEHEPESGVYMAVNIEGVYAEKGVYGSGGKRSSIEAGIIFFHNFVEVETGKAQATAPIDTLVEILELKTVSTYIDLEGANPPSPVAYGTDDREVGNPQPGGQYYRCSCSVPFIIRSAR